MTGGNRVHPEADEYQLLIALTMIDAPKRASSSVSFRRLVAP